MMQVNRAQGNLFSISVFFFIKLIFWNDEQQLNSFFTKKKSKRIIFTTKYSILLNLEVLYYKKPTRFSWMVFQKTKIYLT